MKSINEIFSMLCNEIPDHFIGTGYLRPGISGYYNDKLGDISFLLAGLLQSLMKGRYSDWNADRWIDDSLITKAIVENDLVKMEGIMIWGIENKPEQWTSPFSFTIRLTDDKKDLESFAFLFCDFDKPEILYESFNLERGYWESSVRNWKYYIVSIDNQ